MAYPARPLPDIDTDNIHTIGRTEKGEAVLSNGRSGEVALTICVPCYGESADPLIASLIRMPNAHRASLILFDDGSQDEALTRRLARHVIAFPGPARLATAPENKGRAFARNRLIAMAETDWILFLDADMCPDKTDFLDCYLDAIRNSEGPSLIAGGFSLQQVRPTRETALHAAQARASETLSARERRAAPGRYVFTSNILVHADILRDVSFDDGFEGWGWEDVDWGLNVAKAWPVTHIQNTATHLGLDSTQAILGKYGNSGANFAHLAARHPGSVTSMPLYRMARRLQKIPLKPLWRDGAHWGARQGWLPLRLRLTCLKLYRALCYSGHLQ